MIKKADWDSLIVSVLDKYTLVANDLTVLIVKGSYSRTYELRFIILTRYVKVLELQNVEEDDDQIANGFKDYDEDQITNALDRINIICGSTFNIPIVYHPDLDGYNT